MDYLKTDESPSVKMDKTNHSWYQMFSERLKSDLIEFSPMYAWISIGIALLVVLITIAFTMKRRRRPEVAPAPAVAPPKKYRFRKREKVAFYARKVLRKGKDTASKLQQQVSLIKQGVTVPEFSRSGRRLRKRERMMILAKKMFSKKKTPSLLLKKELPSQLLEADISEEGGPNLPEEVFYLLQSVKVFGHFEKGVFLKLCKHVEILHLNQGDYLFKVGEADKWLYVVQEGQVNLFIYQDQTEVKLSEITVGESLHSLLSILDVLTGHQAPYKTVFARAVKPSSVIRLPAEAFSESFQNRKQWLVQIVQVIMTRLQRVTFLALHNYLGLSQELLIPTNYGEEKKLKIRRQSSVNVLSGMAEKHRLSVSNVHDQLTIKDDEDTFIPSVLPPRSMSMPPDLPSSEASPSKTKQLRFKEVDTVFDSCAGVFHKQSSSPLDQRRLLKEAILMAQELPSSTPVYEEPEDDARSIESHAHGNIFELNEPEVLEMVTSDMCAICGIDDTMLVQENIALLKVYKGFKLIEEGAEDVSLYFVVTGSLKVTQSLPRLGYEDCKEVVLFTAEPGMITGQLAALTGEPSFFSVTTEVDSVIARMERSSFYKIMQKYPHMVLNIAHTLMMRVSPFVRQIDFALDWIIVEAGKPLYRQDATSDCMHIILHGRMRSVLTKTDGRKELVAEYGKGEVVGMNEALWGSPRPTSLHAVRDTELAKIPEGLIKHIRRLHPAVITRLISLVSEKLMGDIISQRQQVWKAKTSDFLTHQQHEHEETTLAYGDVSNHLANLSTVAILPASDDVPLDKFSMELHHSLTHICGNSVLRLSSDLIKQRLGANSMTSVQEYRLSNWLAHNEDQHHIVLYQTDNDMTTWTHRCIRQADAILIVALGDGEPTLGPLESAIEGMAVRALKMLVLLHRPNIKQPTGTVEWLNMRGWLTDHTHIKGPKRLFARTRKSMMEQYWQKLIKMPVNRFSDFSRLARFLTGTTIALVLGGGGARGLSHIGVIQALKSAGIPVDMVGGTSIGAFVGGLWAAHRDVLSVREKTLILCKDMGSYLSKILDLTYPFTSMFTGKAFNKPIKMAMGETQIEDLWLPYFTVTTDITSSKMKVHTDGQVWKYVRASMTYHPFLPPLCDPRDNHLLLDGCFVNNLPGWLWRYVRSSMSLSGYLPPLCDPKDGHLLMDGGYINNLPGDVARSRGACKVIAVDVGSQEEDDFTNYGDSLSGWWLLWRRLTGRWTGRVKVPDLNEIQSRLSYISCNYLLERVIHSDYCFYVRPPIANYKTLDFYKHQELYEVGLKHGRELFTEEWASRFWDKLILERYASSHPSQAKVRGDISFTDLSEVVCQVDQIPTSFYSETETDNEYEYGYESSPEFFSAIGSAMRQSHYQNDGDLLSLSDVESTQKARRNSMSDLESSHKLSSSDDEDGRSLKESSTL